MIFQIFSALFHKMNFQISPEQQQVLLKTPKYLVISAWSYIMYKNVLSSPSKKQSSNGASDENSGPIKLDKNVLKVL
jgi:hypothetical protein